MAYGNPRNSTPKSSREQRLVRKLSRKKKDLKLFRKARKSILRGDDQAYSIGGRQISRYTMSLAEVDAQISKLEDEIDELEDRLEEGSFRRVSYHIPIDL